MSRRLSIKIITLKVQTRQITPKNLPFHRLINVSHPPALSPSATVDPSRLSKMKSSKKTIHIRTTWRPQTIKILDKVRIHHCPDATPETMNICILVKNMIYRGYCTLEASMRPMKRAMASSKTSRATTLNRRNRASVYRSWRCQALRPWRILWTPLHLLL